MTAADWRNCGACGGLADRSTQWMRLRAGISIDRLWKTLRRQATHNMLFETLSDLKKPIRTSLCYFQTMRKRVKTLLQSTRKQKENQTGSMSL
jgi:hypothetical protein